MKKIGFALSILILTVALESCFFLPKNKISFNMNTQDAIALGSANVTNGRFAVPNAFFQARAGEDNGSDEQKIELKKITTEGAFPVFNFTNANTSQFNIVNVIQDPYGASTDTYVILEHCALVWAADNSTDETEIPFGQILAIHEDGSYTDVIGYKAGQNFAQWIVTYGDEPIWSNITFDKTGNLYYVYYKPAEKNEETDQVNLYKYNPQTRATSKLTDVNHTQIDKTARIDEVEYIISEDNKWAFVKLFSSNGETALCAIDLTDSNNTTELFYSADEVYMSFAYDNTNHAVYYQLQNLDYPLYKIPMTDEKFDSSNAELILTDLNSTKIQCTDSGLWSYNNFDGFQQLLDSDGNLVNQIYPEYAIDSMEDEYIVSVKYKFIKNYLFRTSYRDFICFDTITKSPVNIFVNVPDYEKLQILSFGYSDDSIIYSAQNIDTGKIQNGIIDMTDFSVKNLNTEEAFTSLVIVDDSKISN